MFGRALKTAALVAASLLAAGCCMQAGDSIRVQVVGSPDLNDAGAGPQHARFRVYAVKDADAFDSQSVEELATGRVSAVAMESIGRAFPSDSNWLTPGGVRTLQLGVGRAQANARRARRPLPAATEEARQAVRSRGKEGGRTSPHRVRRRKGLDRRVRVTRTA